MKLPLRPSHHSLVTLAIAAAIVLSLLLAGASIETAWTIAWTFIVLLGLAILADFLRSRRSWRAAEPGLTRRLPAAFAIGVRKNVTLSVATRGGRPWRCR